MKKHDNKFILLIKLTIDINVLNLTLIFSMLLSSLDINQYIVYSCTMIAGIMLTTLFKNVSKKYSLANTSKSNSKILISFAIIINTLITIYYFAKGDYITMMLNIIIITCYTLYMKIKQKRKNNLYGVKR